MPTDCTYIHTHICLLYSTVAGHQHVARHVSIASRCLLYSTVQHTRCLPAACLKSTVCACSPADRLPLLRQLPAPSYPNYMRSSYPLGPCLSPAVATFVAATRHTHHTPTAANRASVPTLFHDPSVATLLWRQAAHPHNCLRLFQ